MRKSFKIVFLSLFVVLLVVVGYLYSQIFASNVKKEVEIIFPRDCSYQEVLTILKPHLKNEKSFRWVAQLKKYERSIKSGKYLLKKEMGNNDLINLLRSGSQKIVKVSFNNQQNLKFLAGRIAQEIEPDSISLLEAFMEHSFLEENHFTIENALAMYVPNTYELYWNTSATQFRDRMLKEYQHFWNENRLNQAKNLELSPQQVVTLASIVQKETIITKERPVVAGLYINRLKSGWPLQADPTVVFVLKQQNANKVINRVLNSDLLIESPYNTYLNKGVPPGPIDMPDISTIDAVLNYEKHSYYYMCASTTRIGKHEFSKTLAQHNRYARKYQRWLSRQGVRR